GIESLRRATVAKPDFVEAYEALGRVALAADRLEESERAYQRLTELVPHEPAPYMQLGTIYDRMHRTDDAIACFRRVAELRPDDMEALEWYGYALHIAGREAEAVPPFEKVLAR